MTFKNQFVTGREVLAALDVPGAAAVKFSYYKTSIPYCGIRSHGSQSKEDLMYQQDTTPVAPAETTAPSAQEFYFPAGGGTDPDFHLPVDREHVRGRFSRWIHGLPGFSGNRP